MTIERGYETTPVTQTLELKPGEERSVEFRMRRFTDMHKLGWTSGDTHIHWVKNSWDQNEELDLLYYYQFVNCGFHIGLTNGSDHPARVAGAVRAYVRLDGPFTYPRWLDGVRHGRTFVTSGPLVMLTVNGVDIGDTLQATNDTPLHVHARAESRFPIGTLQLVSNGEVLKSVTTEEREATIDFDMVAEKSRWFTVRASRSDQFDCLTGPDIAHTSAVYVVVDGREVIRREAVEFWMQNVRQHSERIRTLAQFANDQQRQEALQHVAEGLAHYESLLSRAVE